MNPHPSRWSVSIKANRRFIQWPGWQELRVTFPLALGFFAFFYLVYGSTAWLVEFIPWRHDVGFAWERHIPFLPLSAYVYLSLGLMMWLVLFVIRDRDRIWLLTRIISAQVVICATCFLLFPVENNYPPRVVTAEMPQVFVIADTVNLNNNQFPSLHVCLAMTTAIVLMTGASQLWLRLFLLLWAIAISLSTLTMHEHNLLDVIGGAALALWGAGRWISRAGQLTPASD